MVALLALSSADDPLAGLGQAIFAEPALSADHHISCQTCHDPAHRFTDARPLAAGVFGKVGTRNAPSLLDIEQHSSFFWDGRRTRLEDAVTDPFTNPAEMGLKDTDELLARVRGDRKLMQRFSAVFPKQETPTMKQIQAALAGYVRSLPKDASDYDRSKENPAALSAQARLGLSLFTGAAGCGECHRIDATAAASSFTDQAFHHSGIAQQTGGETLAQAAATAASLPQGDPALLGPAILTDATLADLGRFVVTRRPADIGAFRTPSLRNVAETAPYMHDGSIATLTEAVDHEIYYRAFSTGRSISLSPAERQAIVAFLQALTEKPELPRADVAKAQR